MLVVETAAEFSAHLGHEAGVSDWLTVDQARIDAFADATGDHQWIHVDRERAAREMPGGRTIAHGYLTLSLLPLLAPQTYAVRRRSRGINYGANRVRFTAPVPAGARVRLRQTVQAVDAMDAMDGGARVTFLATMEIEGSDRPALIAEVIVVIYD